MIDPRHRVLCCMLFLFAGLRASGEEANNRPLRLEVEPLAPKLIGGSSRQQLAIAGRFADGSIRDLTAEAKYRVVNDRVAVVNKQGVVTPVGDGRTEIKVEADGRETSVSVEVAQSSQTRAVGFRLDVAPLLSKAGCNAGACHGNLNGKGGFRLSLRGDDPSFDLAALMRDAFNRRLDLVHPEQSLFLLKPTGQVPHEGGRRFSIDSIEARTLLAWIDSLAKDDQATSPRVVKVSVFPSERLNAAPCLSQQLIVTAELSDGSTRDVTRQASYDVNEPTKAGVSEDGRVETSGPGEIVVAVRYQTGRAVSRLAFLADRPNFVWTAPKESNIVDRLVFAKLKSLKINPSSPSSDSVFVRRAYLDAIGVLPTIEEARSFLEDSDPSKRAKLVDRLLARPEFADHWSLKWADLLRNEEKAMGAKGTWVFQRLASRSNRRGCAARRVRPQSLNRAARHGGILPRAFIEPIATLRPRPKRSRSLPRRPTSMRALP